MKLNICSRFGILPSCNHCFCLPCIRKWRQAKQFEHKIIRACPECRLVLASNIRIWLIPNLIIFRQTSDYICPSRFWVETPEEKERLLSDYKKNLGQKECKYFNKVRQEEDSRCDRASVYFKYLYIFNILNDQGSGECPFGNKCFYQHADKDGRSVYTYNKGSLKI